MTKILELYGVPTRSGLEVHWESVVEQEICPYLHRKCLKVRKSQPYITIGTCSVLYGREQKEVIICPQRLLERRQIFLDCIHLLTLHEPGNELHIVSEIGIPGGNVDYFLVSARNKEVRDFVGIELQTLDTTGTIWPERQRFLQSKGIEIPAGDTAIDSDKTFGMNWKMTAKTILIQLHHKVQTFEEINKHLVLVIQDYFMNYIKGAFRFGHLNNALLGDSAHFHVYHLTQNEESSAFRLELDTRFSTDADGIAASLGLQTSHKMELETITRLLATRMSNKTLFLLG
ncbi:MAG TPA: NotI family restriction endonuclease [Ktedonobacteraceae bacterium]|nr:NotI family restriction endonuclease [Ktedonobacteraceae bacterium]